MGDFADYYKLTGMTNKLFSLQKYSHLIAVFFVAGFIFLYFSSPYFVNEKNENWETELDKRSNNIKSGVVNKFEKIFKPLLSTGKNLGTLLHQEDNSEEHIRWFSLLKNKPFADYAVFIYDSTKKLFAWNTNTLTVEPDIFNSIPIGVIDFYDSDLFVSAVYCDTVKLKGGLYYFQMHKPVEKKYKYDNENFSPLSISEELSTEYNTEIVLKPGIERSVTDGRYENVEILNFSGDVIGVVDFLKPLKDAAINSYIDNLKSLKDILLILAFLFFVWKISGLKILFSSRWLQNSFLILFFSALRWMLYIFEIPSKYLPADIVESSYFSSGFAGGIVSSPFEFFVTAVMLLIICLSIFNNVLKFKPAVTKIKYRILSEYLFAALLVFIYLVLLRGLGAAVKSVIFDSSLFYFKFNDLLPKLPIAFMHFNLFLLGACSVAASVALLLYLQKKYSAYFNPVKVILSLFVIFQFSGILYDYFQKEPQGTPVLRIIYITLTLLITWLIYRKKILLFGKYISFSILASFISISMLMYYNSKLEIESLKTVVFEINRTNENWLEFIVNQSADEAEDYIKSKNISGKSNFSALAFICWSNSPLEEEGYSSSVKIYSGDGSVLGDFNNNFNRSYIILNEAILNVKRPLEFIQQEVDNKKKILTSIRRISLPGGETGYITVSILIDKSKFWIDKFEGFYTGNNTNIASPVDIDQLRIIEIQDGKVTRTQGDFSPGRRTIRQFIEADFTKFDDCWKEITIGDEDFIFYLMKFPREADRILCVGKTQKNIPFRLFDFFKVFLVHTFYVLVIGLILLLTIAAKTMDFRITFNMRLLSAFLIISLIPLIVLAFYFRQISEENNVEAVKYKLEKRAVKLEEYLKKYWGENNGPMLNRATDDLGINFELYKYNKLKYSSSSYIYKTGAIADYVDPEAFVKLFHRGYNSLLNEEKLEKYKYEAFYYKTDIRGENLIIKIGTAFNPVSLPMGRSDIDVFLFGTYSLAVLIIILISTLLARQISLPILKLTSAAKAVESGDLNYSLKNNYKGEIQDLINSFNKMVKGLRKSQNELAEVERELAWKEMARQVAHEIKNPLTPMKLLIQQLIIAYKDKSPKFDSIFEKVTTTTIRQIDTLKNIASEFSNFAQMPKLKLEKLDLIDSIRNTVNLFADEQAKIKIETELEKAEIEADPDQLNRCIINLVRNAIQAGSTGIYIKIGFSNEKYFVEIKDNGRGILPENRGKIFLPNFTTKTEGMGLGLSMVKRFIELINGTIELVDSDEKGTLFLLSFPEIKNA